MGVTSRVCMGTSSRGGEATTAAKSHLIHRSWLQYPPQPNVTLKGMDSALSPPKQNCLHSVVVVPLRPTSLVSPLLIYASLLGELVELKLVCV